MAEEQELKLVFKPSNGTPNFDLSFPKAVKVKQVK